MTPRFTEAIQGSETISEVGSRRIYLFSAFEGLYDSPLRWFSYLPNDEDLVVDGCANLMHFSLDCNNSTCHDIWHG